MIRGGGRLMHLAAIRGKRAGTERPTVVTKELAVGDLVSPDGFAVTVQDIEQHDRTRTIRQCHGATGHRDGCFSVVMSVLELIADDFEIARW